MKISEFYLIFFIYSFLGWLWESFPCSIVELDKIHNRGFLLGPCCPIYGVGATLSYFTLKGFQSSLSIFIYSAFLCCTVEYMIGYFLERFFHKKWWDYSNYPFQIKSRVCLYGLIIFGFGNIAIVKKLTPIMIFFLSIADNKLINLITSILGVLFAIDILLTLNNLAKASKTLDKIYKILSQKIEENFNYLNESEKFSKIKLMSESKNVKVKLENFNSILKEREKNIKKIIAQK